MHISTTARHCELDPGVRLFAEQRLGKLGRFARDIREAHLVLTTEKYRHTAEITLKLRHLDMVSRRESTDARAAIDRAAERLEQQLRRLKDKRVNRKRGAPAVNGGPDGESPERDEAGPWTGED